MKRDRLLTVMKQLKQTIGDNMLLFQAEQKAIKLRKIEENRTLTIQANHNDNEKPQSLSTTVLCHVRYLFLFLDLFDIVWFQLSSSKNTTFRLIKDFTDLLPEKSSQEQRALLSSEDLKRIETIQLSYEQRIELGS